MRDLSIFSLLFIQLFIYGSVDSWIFILYSGYNSILLYEFCFSNCSSFGHLGTCSVCSCDPLMYPHHCEFMYLFFDHFLLPGTRCSRSSCLFPAQHLESAVSQGCLILFTGERLGNKIWVLGVCVHCSRGMFLGPLN